MSEITYNDHQIFSCVKPKDLLTLSRANKSLHHWLTSSESDSVWIASRNTMLFHMPDTRDRDGGKRAVFMPGPLPGFTHAQNARLLFDWHCYVRCPPKFRQSGILTFCPSIGLPTFRCEYIPSPAKASVLVLQRFQVRLDITCPISPLNFPSIMLNRLRSLTHIREQINTAGGKVDPFVLKMVPTDGSEFHVG